MNVKSSIASVLRHYPPLFRLSSRVYHRMNGGFRTLSPGTLDALDRAFALARRERRGDIGDYYEFGLFRGRTFLHAYEACERLDLQDTHLYGFDSFQGLPEVEDVDAAGGIFFAGQFAASRSEVEKHLTEHGLDWSRATLVEGFFDEVLTPQLKQSLPRRCAGVVLLDCDLYSSTIVSLEWLEDMLIDHAVVLFDDWTSYGGSGELGQQRALAEFLDRHPRWVTDELWPFDRHGTAFRFRLRRPG
ncbi:MAG: class I SAM-dependent methyltransferase [Gammaproteobacteria bacterium]|nr:class I SAM-dependent methyltransferase [Gammaproteobacteria bacterium]